ncbi:hypothetical protein RUM44_007631 [Polyplax serrata]|uniref:CCDC92/74 N-terminal domain-containing protein n=1 Tax=Polyplax serrata TaxID=468196 RepID=A0ABR1BA56_POLSC
MSSKVMVNLPSDPFQQVRKKHQQEIVTAEVPGLLGLTSTDPIIRANQLEQNIRFLQEQHQVMLSGLHREIEMLRQKNRDLQFQIVFTNGINHIQNSPSSDEDHQKPFAFSPEQVNVTPLQVEILERNIADLRMNLSEARTRNVYLQNIIDEQKKKMSALENEKLDMAAVGRKIGKENLTSKGKPQESVECTDDLQEKLEDADRLIRRLKRENEEQRKEIVSLRMSMNRGKIDNRRNEGGNTHRGYYKNGQQNQGSRFPPLQGHSHWRNRSNSNFSLDNAGGQTSDRENGRTSREPEVVGRAIPSLPYLRDRNNGSTSTGYSNPAYNNYQGGNLKRGYYFHRKHEDHRSNGRAGRRDQSHQHDSQ